MGAVNTTYTFTATDTITSTKMNNIIDETTITTDAIIGTTLEVATGKLKVRSAGITSNELATGSVTSNAIADGAIVNDDINASAAIDPSKLGSGALPAGATITTSNIVDASITAPKLNGAQTGTAPIFGVRSWVTFDMTRNSTGGSDVLNTDRYIYASGNVSSVLKTATGEFEVNFTTDMPSVNYVHSGSGMDTDSTGDVIIGRANAATKTVSKIKLKSTNNASVATNFPEIGLMFIG